MPFVPSSFLFLVAMASNLLVAITSTLIASLLLALKAPEGIFVTPEAAVQPDSHALQARSLSTWQTQSKRNSSGKYLISLRLGSFCTDWAYICSSNVTSSFLLLVVMASTLVASRS